MEAGKRVIKNTIILYSQLILSMAVGLFTTRILLATFGEVNYGIYVLIGGVIGLLSILNSNMSGSSMRFIAHAMGKEDLYISLKTFNTTMVIHLVLAFIVVILMELGGYLFFDYILKIPPDKINDAWLLFHLMVASAFLSIISVPYDAIMNAHEDLFFLSLIDLVAVVMRFGGAVLVSFNADNALVLYGVILLSIEFIVRITKQIYSVKKYKECNIKLRKFFDKKIFNEIIYFTSWNFFGSLGAMATTRFNSLFINHFFGVKLNAAEGLSSNVSSSVNMVSVSMTRAINPQIMKSEGGGDREKMLRISQLSTKYSMFLFTLFGIPVFINIEYLMNLWLPTIPDYTVIFTRFLLVILFIEKFSFEITTAIKATGNIKRFQIIETSIRLLSAVGVFIVLSIYKSPLMIYYVGIIFSFIIYINRLFFGHLVLGLNVYMFLKKTLFNFCPILVIALIPIYLLNFLNLQPVTYLFFSSSFFVIFFSVCFFSVGMSAEERKKIISILLSIILKK